MSETEYDDYSEAEVFDDDDGADDVYEVDEFEDKPRPWRLIIVISIVAVILVALIYVGVSGNLGGDNGTGDGDGDDDGDDDGTNDNYPPRASARVVGGSIQTFLVGEEIEFDASLSSDRDGDNLTYSWDFDLADDIQEDATGETVTHTYDAEGNYTITLTVSDGTNESQDTVDITVEDTIVVEFQSTGEQRPVQGTQYQLTVTKATKHVYINTLFFKLTSAANGTVIANGSLYNISAAVTDPIYFIDYDQRISENDTIVIKDESGAQEGDIFELYYGTDLEHAEKVGETVLVITIPFP